MTRRHAQWMLIGMIVAGCAPRTSTVSTRSAGIVFGSSHTAPSDESGKRAQPPASETLACHGEDFCREMVAARFDDEARSEAVEECQRYRGRSSADACPRERLVAVCHLEGEHGPLSVFAYQQQAADKMSDLCDSAGGSYVAQGILR
jgi:hypothetical protein